MASALIASSFTGAAIKAASAAAPVARRSVVVRADAETAAEKPMTGKEFMMSLPGVAGPTGFFDPYGFCEDISVGEANRFREAEVTHGRVAMLATVGWLVQEQFHPLFGSNITGPAFGHFQEVEAVFPAFWELITFCIALAEGRRIAVGWATPGQENFLKADYVAGEIGFDPLGLMEGKSEKEIFDIKTKELNNGRLAMIAWIGFCGQEAVTGSPLF